MAKELLYVNLNYIHHVLSPKTRVVTMCLGISICGVGAWCLTQSAGNYAALASGVVNALVGATAFIFSFRHMPNFAKKFIRLSESSVKIKNHWFIPRHKFCWEDIEKIERFWDHNGKRSFEITAKGKRYTIR